MLINERNVLPELMAGKVTRNSNMKLKSNDPECKILLIIDLKHGHLSH